MTKIKRFSREHDEIVLAMVRGRADGLSLSALATKFSAGISSVQMATSSVKKADAKESGEDVSKYYW